MSLAETVLHAPDSVTRPSFHGNWLTRILVAVSSEVDGNDIVPNKGRTAPALPLGSLVDDCPKTIQILCGGPAHHPCRVVIDKVISLRSGPFVAAKDLR